MSKKHRLTWSVHVDNEYKHINIMPDNDLDEHVHDFCWCEPRVEEQSGWITFVHRSTDRREFFEEQETLH